MTERIVYWISQNAPSAETLERVAKALREGANLEIADVEAECESIATAIEAMARAYRFTTDDKAAQTKEAQKMEHTDDVFGFSDIQVHIDNLHRRIAGRIKDSYIEGYEAAGRVFKQKLDSGWQLVPEEPTEGMLYAGSTASLICRADAIRLYRAMLAAAPKPEWKKE